MTKMHTTPLRARFGRRAAVVGSVLAAALVGTAVPALAQDIVPIPVSGDPAAAAIDLYAVAGSMNLPGETGITVWGYTAPGAGVIAAPGGPVLTVVEDTPVTITLHNNLTEATSLVVRGQAMPTDLAGVAAGGTKDYKFTPTEPGTYIYEAGLMNNTQHQTAMGLHGAFVVLPATGTPYGSAHESAVVISEIDPVLNRLVDPSTFDMRNFKPKYTLFNGATYPEATPVLTTAAPGDKVLLRYVNAGISYHSMSVLGASQQIVADDGHKLTQPYSVVAQTVGPGQATDAVVTVPLGSGAGTLLSVFDANLQLRNKGRRPAQNLTPSVAGGAVGFIQVAGTASADDTVGPVTSNVVALRGFSDTTLTATISDVTTGNNGVAAAEYRVNGGTWTPMTLTGGPSSFDATVTFSNLPLGAHTISVRGQDNAAIPNWGVAASTVVSTDTVGPLVSGIKVTPTNTNGTADVAVHATASDVGRGGSNIDTLSAQYQIYGAALAPVAFGPMTVNNSAVTVSVDGLIPQATIAGLAPYVYRVEVTVLDEAANPSEMLSLPPVNLVVDKAGPGVTDLAANPPVTNGKTGFNATIKSVRITGNAKDDLSATLRVEGFIDPPNAPVSHTHVSGTGFLFLPTDGTWNPPSGKNDQEAIYADIPLGTIAGLADGVYTIHVHAKDAAGNWGPFTATTVTVDKTAPTITAALAPDTIGFGTASATLNLTVNDGTGTGVVGGQYWVDGSATPPASPIAFVGTGPLTLNTSALAGGTHTVYSRVRDGALNWSAVTSAQLYVVRAVNDTQSISANGSTTQTSDVNSANGVLVNDQPTAVGGRTAALLSAPVRTSGNGAGTIVVSCINSLGTPVAGNAICTNGAFRVTLNGVGNTNNQRRNSKRGTYTFTYTETLNGVISNVATVTIVVN